LGQVGEATITITNNGTGGFVIVDALQLLPIDR
jgi:TM2 domain-containing membrane protein YozV